MNIRIESWIRLIFFDKNPKYKITFFYVVYHQGYHIISLTTKSNHRIFSPHKGNDKRFLEIEHFLINNCN